MPDRARLIELANTTLAALERHDSAALPRIAGCRYTENGAELSWDSGLWRSAGRIGSKMFVADVDRQQVVAYASAGEPGEALLLALRLRAAQSKLAELEILIARQGQASVFDAEAFRDPPAAYEALVPVPERSARLQLQAAADRYFDGIEQNSATDVPFHAGCQRFENGVQTTGNPAFLGGMGCREQLDRKLFTYIERVRARRYPICDEERGAVLACVFLDVPGTVTTFESGGRTYELPAQMRVPRSVLLFELFKVVSGQIGRIDAFMVNLPYRANSGWD